METAVRLDGIGKSYRVYPTPLSRLRELFSRRTLYREFHALRDIDLVIKRGATLGVVGENGAGKSTLLEVIAGTLAPSEGTLEVKGSVFGILELGIGFHPEFTGRENIFFYGDVLGLKRSTVARKFAAIVAFSELGAFIEQPLRTYSTGMRMRLAFSLVATLEPEILIVDEALAVGDMHFQKKCIERMMEIKEHGNTIVFCSHSTYQIGMFCDQAVWVKDGRIEMYGATNQVINAYEAYLLKKDSQTSDASTQVKGPTRSARVLITTFELENRQPVSCGEDLRFHIETECTQDDLAYHVSLSIKMENGYGIYATGTHLVNKPPITGKRRSLDIVYPKAPILGGFYSANARIFDDKGMMIYDEKIIPQIEFARTSKELGVCQLENIWTIT